MKEEAVELEIPLLLPGVEAEDDACLARLEAALQSHKGLQRAHLERDKRPVLKRMGVQETVMLTGDNTGVAAAIAKQVGLTDFRADLMPEDKVKAIRNLTEKYGETAMVGDGVNDAPALANATLGIAMGGAGTDVALETADVALMGDDLAKLPFAVGLGRATRAIIMQNLFISLGVIFLLIAASLAGWAGIGVAILFHEGSTIVVALNALRLLRFTERA